MRDCRRQPQDRRCQESRVRVEVEEILRLSARKAAASTAQARIARRLATPSRPSRPDGLACGRAGQTDRHATWPSGTPCAATTLFISPPCFRRRARVRSLCLLGGRSPCPAHKLGTSSFLVDGPRLQGGQRAINAIAIWLALRNAASSAEMQSGKLAASAFADGRTRKDRNSGNPG
jgi:hypothetical protein